jgi:flagellar protein FlaG
MIAMAIISSNETGQSVAGTLADLGNLVKNGPEEIIRNSGSSATDAPHLLAPDEKTVREAVSKISEFVKSFSRDLEFSVDDATKKIVIKVKVRDSGEVVRQIPSEEALQIADSLDALRGLLIREHV